ncbi:putative alpha beta hydrolase fold family protein [Coleophoma cylindrospora]|uniref:Putative alpha beta hydrolase fold family protein n=1 Tax=Coleophoma cylindrospora TaxID=1849047 RepID=A0A3D8S852_9HELO|nr:putative alpha beta hydrolase fold family protein [Coleophoma cylindrospora]
MASIDLVSPNPKRAQYARVLQHQRVEAKSSLWEKQSLISAKALMLVLIAAFLYLSQALSRKQSYFNTPKEQIVWSWESIAPSPELKWTSCYDEFECARLQLPLDWLDVSNKSTVAVAVLRKNATSQENYKGPLFVNPGGPGGSGVAMVKRQWKALQIAVGENHDIIGFDPRGVGATTPSAHCWSEPRAERIWGIQKLGLVDSHPGMIYDLYAKQSLESKNCEASLGDLARFVGTASVARDMLAILEQTGYEKLRYWGLSYGTLLGGTFAAMYPERIERMVTDGNVNYSEWYNGTGIHYTDNTDHVMQAFFDLCHKSGPEKCAFYSSTPTLIQQRLEDLYLRLRKYPLQVLPSETATTSRMQDIGLSSPEIITYSDVKFAVIYSLYQPLFFFSSLATVLAALDEGDGLPFLEMSIYRGYRQPSFSCSCDSPACEDQRPGWPLDAVGNGDAATYVKCSEGDTDPSRDSLEAIENYETALREKSPMSAPVMFGIRLACAGWKSRTKWNFVGPFNQNTSYPLLFIANTADNITPLSSAIHDSSFFPGSSVLIQNSYGHTSLSCPSKCTAQHRLAYFQNGTLPVNGTICEGDMIPFGIVKEGKASDIEVSCEDDREGKMAWALRELMKLPLAGAFM